MSIIALFIPRQLLSNNTRYDMHQLSKLVKVPLWWQGLLRLSQLFAKFKKQQATVANMAGSCIVLCENVDPVNVEKS